MLFYCTIGSFDIVQPLLVGVFMCLIISAWFRGYHNPTARETFFDSEMKAQKTCSCHGATLPYLTNIALNKYVGIRPFLRVSQKRLNYLIMPLIRRIHRHWSAVKRLKGGDMIRGLCLRRLFASIFQDFPGGGWGGGVMSAMGGMWGQWVKTGAISDDLKQCAS